jgi:hypothetical protein
MKNIIFILFTITTISCNTPITNNEIECNNNNALVIVNDSIEIKAVPDTINQCHSCPGMLVIIRDSLIDTLQCGLWGQPSKYKLINDRLITEIEHYMGGSVEYTVSVYEIPLDAPIELITRKRIGKMNYKYIRLNPDSVHTTRYNFESNLNNCILSINIDSITTYELYDTLSSGKIQFKYNIWETLE